MNCFLSMCLQYLQGRGCWMKPCRGPPGPFPSCHFSQGPNAATLPVPANEKPWWCQAGVVTIVFSYHWTSIWTKILLCRGPTRIKRHPSPSWDYGGNPERGALSSQDEQATQTAVFFCLPGHADKR